jgi:beta-lactamase regulating signal transducer with metallopeptidase domain
MDILKNLLEITVYSTVLYAAVMLFKTLFKKHASPLLLYFIWFLLIARLLIPVTPDPGFSFITLPAPEAQEAAVYPAAPFGSAEAVVPADRGTVYSSQADPVSDFGDTADHTPVLPQPFATRPEFDAAQLLLLAWIAGAAFFLLRFMIESSLLKKRLLREAAPPPSAVLSLAKEIQTELNLRNNIKIKVLDGITSPALTVNFKPTVMLLGELLTGGSTRVEYALRHELMHVKRADHLVCILLSVLRAMYWFHPVVWLASRQMNLDMETACDYMVVKRMGPGQKKDYAKTILNMYCEGKAGLTLGMGLENTRKAAERRIRGIFTRSGRGMKAKIWAVLLAAVMLIACFTTACQPAYASAASSGSRFQVPAEWNESMQYGNLTIDVDTSVTMPDVDAYPVVRVEPAALPQERIEQIVKYFVADRITKDSEWEQLEKILQEGANKTHWGVSSRDENGIYANFNWQKAGNGNLYSRFVYSTEFNYEYQTETYYSENKEWIQNPGMRKVEYEELFNGVQISSEDAQAQAQKVIDGLDIGYVQLAGVQKAVLLGYDLTNDNKGDWPDKGGWFFEYMRSPGGIPGYDMSDNIKPDTQGEFCPPYPLESVKIIVTDNGVEYFDWVGYCNVLKTENEDAALVPFEQIQQKLLEQINTERSPLLSNSSMKDVLITVNSAQLRMGLIQSEEDIYQSLMVPVWVFDTTEAYSLANGKTTHSNLTYMIDAVSGNEIDAARIYGKGSAYL